MPFLAEFLIVATSHLLAVMSPGPDFVMVSRNSLVYSRAVGIYSAIGLGLGILVHVTYSLIGIGLVISQSILLFTILKFAGAAYLLYIGWQCLRAKPHGEQVVTMEKRDNIGAFAAIRIGFLTNVLNPKATLFFFALFTQVISVQTPTAVKVFYGLEMSLATFVWFAIVAVILSHNTIRRRFISVSHWLERSFGVILIALGVKVALSSSK
jgi:RhtB (resistance to homoserine/threonine) family protein